MLDSPAISLKTSVRAVPETLVAHVKHPKNETVLLSLPAGRYFGLNSTGSYVWQVIQQPITVESLLSGMVQRFNVEASVCQSDLIELLDRMTAAGLIEVSQPG